eukprot:TRINITY_DN750_c0_g1_i1.p1 TRINITY_DN750_c0_g1~~TRINITY_DN750_c0_g1_i1.p1  ORF type:complete len:125 (-),score=28.22 TRINITY_DN750_c0_g1_i1:69-443(-)
MSWQAYVDDQLVGAGFAGAAIIGLDGGSWASKNLNLKPGEGQKIANLFKNPANAYAEGITVNGIKYLCVKSDDRSIYGKKAATGVNCVKTSKAVLIGIYAEGFQPGQAANTIEKLADYLISTGF